MRPIIFGGESIRAILDGRKTMTRRVIKTPFSPIEFTRWHPDDPSIALFAGDDPDGYVNHWSCRSPYGVVGDGLWVREAWGFLGFSTHLRKHKAHALYLADDSRRTVAFPSFDEMAASMPQQNITMPENYEDLALWKQRMIHSELLTAWWKRKKKISPIFMPRWASRIDLAVTGMRVERLQDISEEDARAEGVTVGAYPTIDGYWLEDEGSSLTGGFAARWDAINAKRGYSWESNPWVWAPTFERVNVSG